VDLAIAPPSGILRTVGLYGFGLSAGFFVGCGGGVPRCPRPLCAMTERVTKLRHPISESSDSNLKLLENILPAFPGGISEVNAEWEFITKWSAFRGL
jgi:hypothetical protein